MEPRQLKRKVLALIDAYNRRDFDALVRDVAEQARWSDRTTGKTYQGQEGVVQFNKNWISAFPDMKIEVTNCMAGTEGVVAELTARGKHTGPLAGPDGEIPPTNRQIEHSFCRIYRFENEKIVESVIYYDALGLMRKLGILPGESRMVA